MTLQKWVNRFFFILVFLLPWQTQWIFSQQLLQGQTWEYGKCSLYATEIFLFVLFLLRCCSFSDFFQNTPLHFWGMVSKQKKFFILVLVALIFLSILFSQQKIISLVHIMHVGFVGLFVLLALDKRVSFSFFANAFFAGLVLPCLLGWYQVFTGFSPAFTWLGMASQEATRLGTAVIETNAGRLLRAYGSFPHPNIFGGYIAVATIFLFWFLSTQNKRPHSFWLSVVLIVFSSTLVITFSRGAWLIFFLGILFVFLLHKHFSLFYFSKAFLFAGVIFLSFGVTTSFFSEQIFSRFEMTSRLEQISLQERTQSFESSKTVIKQDLFFGTGPGAYTVALSEAFPGHPAWWYQPVHNMFVLLFAEVGLLGFLVLIIFCLWERNFFPFLLLLTVPGLFDHYLWSLWPGMILSGIMFVFLFKNVVQ